MYRAIAIAIYHLYSRSVLDYVLPPYLKKSNVLDFYIVFTKLDVLLI